MELRRKFEDMQLLLSSEQAAKEKLGKTNSDLLRRVNELSLQTEKYSSFTENY